MASPTSNAVNAYAISLSGEPLVDALLFGVRWGSSSSSTELTFSFPDSQSFWLSPQYSSRDEPFTGFSGLSGGDAANVRLALDQWSHYANVRFVEVAETISNVGEIRIGQTRATVNPEEQAHAYYPSYIPSAGDIWLNAGVRTGEGITPGGAEYYTVLHEIGHALGLKHPFDVFSQNSTVMADEFDYLAYTVMSYEILPGRRVDSYGLSFYPTTPMGVDILAIQAIYGKNTTYNSGNNNYIFNEGADYFQTLFDTGGVDTITWNAGTQSASIDLRSDSWSDLGNTLWLFDRSGAVIDEKDLTVYIYLDTVIENAVGGGGSDILTGNNAGNSLDGRAGHDNLFGGGGADTLIGGDGNDHLYGQSPSGGADGADSLAGGAGSDYLQGNAGNDVLDGGDGSDRINGGANDDEIAGGGDNDTLNGNVGNDRVDGGAGNDSLRGGQNNDSIAGGAGNDVLSGDLGADRLTGGGGADVFMAASGSTLAAPDVITDFEDGTDRLSIGFVPVAVLTGSAQPDAPTAATIAQQLLDGRAGNAEVAALQVGSDSYIFYAINGGATVDAAIVVLGTATTIFSVGDFA